MLLHAVEMINGCCFVSIGPTICRSGRIKLSQIICRWWCLFLFRPCLLLLEPCLFRTSFHLASYLFPFLHFDLTLFHLLRNLSHLIFLLVMTVFHLFFHFFNEIRASIFCFPHLVLKVKCSWDAVFGFTTKNHLTILSHFWHQM